MAGCVYVVTTTAEISIESTFADTVRQKDLIKLYSQLDHNILIKEYGIYFKGVTSTSPPVRMVLQACSTNATNFTATTQVQIAGPAMTSHVASYTNNTTTTVVTGNLYRVKEVHPQLGFQEKFGPGDEINWGTVNNSIMLSIFSATTLECVAEIVYEE